MAYDVLREGQPARASRVYLEILYLAAHESEAAVDEALGQLLAASEALSVASVQALVERGVRPATVPAVSVTEVCLNVYDALFDTKEWSHDDREGSEEGAVALLEGVAFASVSSRF
jgi:hypothetical protein